MINCNYIPNFLVFQNGYMAFCCSNGPLGSSPKVLLDSSDDVAELAEQYVEMCEVAVKEMNGEKKIELLKGCLNCAEVMKDTRNINYDKKINYINLSIYPSVCQCKCIYCGFANDNELNNYEKAKASNYARKATQIISYLDKKGFIDRKNVRVQLAAGEITINPHKDLIFNAVKDFKCLFFSNGFVYDSQIAEILEKTKSYVQCDLDSGTAETYKRIKGFDKFHLVIENLEKYLQHGNVVLKYLVMPGINDDIINFEGIIGIMKNLNRNCLHISRDNREKNSLEIDKVLGSIARLSALLDKNGLSSLYCSPLFTQKHIDKINEYKKILREEI